MQAILPFISQLVQNNRRDWFEEHREEYDSARSAFEQLVNTLLSRLVPLEPGLAGLEPKDCIFRIYRDVRFSKNKNPYKNHFGAYFAEGGKKSLKAGYYLHLEPGGKSMLAGGMYAPPAEYLKKIRQEIDYNGPELRRILDAPAFRQYFGGISGESLKTTPRDYPADHPDIDLLRQKDFTAVHYLSDAQVEDPDLVEYALTVWKAMKPLNDFLNRAVT